MTPAKLLTMGASVQLSAQPSRDELKNCEQGSAIWKAARCGIVTASRCVDVIATTKKGEGAARANYRAELIAEILTGVPCEQFVSREMQWGLEQERYARAAYELQRDVMVETCGFVLHPDLKRFGASPDGGLVGDVGMIEIKCPNTTTHLKWMLAGVVPVEHAPQMLGELACHPDRMWCDFVSFDPRLPAHLQLFVRRFHRNDQLIEALETEIAHFNAEIDSEINRLPGDGSPIVNMLDYTDNDEIMI